MKYLDYGYYIYDSKLYLNKIEAMNEALARKDYTPNIKFLFNDDVYAKIDCTVEPELSLSDYYWKRAQQLRKQYDYLILMYSGGSDSYQILMTFLKNGIFLDEIRTLYPISILKKIQATPDPQHPFGLLFEYEFAALPGLQLAKQLSPKTKINIIDTVSVYQKSYNENWLPYIYQDFRTSGGLYHTIRRTDESIQLQKEVENWKKSVGVIYGADKPYMRIDSNNYLYFYFSDFSRCGAQHIYLFGNDLAFRPEMFFWARNSPMITLKQAHVIKRAIDQDRILYDEVIKSGQVTPQMSINLLYPDWDHKYQKRLKHNDECITSFLLGDRVPSLTQLKNDHLNTQYSKLDIVNPLSINHSDRWFTISESTRHYLGEIHWR